MFRLSSAIFREVLKYRTDYFYRIIIIISLLNTEALKNIIFFPAECFNVTNKKENQVNRIRKPEKPETFEL